MTVIARWWLLVDEYGNPVYTERAHDGEPMPTAEHDGNRVLEVVPADQLQGAVSDLAEANARIETLLAAENKAWRDAQTWKERAIESGWGQS